MTRTTESQKMSVEPMGQRHLSRVWEIEKAAHTHPWSQSMINAIDSRGACHHVLVADQEVVGYFYAQNIVGEVTLLNIAVAPRSQGKGLGKALIEHLIAVCLDAGAESIWLEVRESNRAAISLYESAGFNEVDRRIAYYPAQKGREDALIMSYLFL